MNTFGVVLVGVAIAVGLVGILVPLLPGTLLVYAAVVTWALVERTAAAWLTLGVVTVLLAATLLAKYLLPTRRMRDAGVGTSTLVAGAVLGIVGFFVVPVVGLVLGFVGGVYLAELAVRHDAQRAWASTVHASKGVLLSVGIELTGGVLAAVAWGVGVLAS